MTRKIVGRVATIYCLADDTGVRYIGSTIQSLDDRYRQHVDSCWNDERPVDIWMAENILKGHTPTITALVTCPRRHRWIYEEKITQHCRSRAQLLNIYDGPKRISKS